ncbi:hypothetical protein WICANDRAFT_65549 [Wickerhamomyces anomalus NRRL Y-366-8]|uniref:Uncharacterized protein n=1 Tax=Wickerhamomyces anomalus (strain ATCC 58044 / CBS 1984 / NCYC 433 / NRRL Y-366-8) TaxID=683960 RepID=A0A1E3NWB7_WICAA|nr:uncharacterized protein WICANDRAFT_65549 [Wickerhamomyces anomalus NRRL Y-366-8]ODQ57290.1 hypothetical protein WICANDRAFT_65549 [Wickerhamomyces anomalus NRRL Y-366-8]
MLATVTHKRFLNPSKAKLAKLALSVRWKSTKLVNLINSLEEPPMLHYNQYLKKVDDVGDYVIAQRYAEFMDQLEPDENKNQFAKIALSTPSLLSGEERSIAIRNPHHNSDVTTDTKQEPLSGCSINSSKFKNINNQTHVEQIDYLSDSKILKDINKHFHILEEYQNKIPSRELSMFNWLNCESECISLSHISEGDVQRLFDRKILSPICTIIQKVYGVKIQPRQQMYNKEGKIYPDITMESANGKGSVVVEVKKDLPAANELNKQDISKLLKINGVQQVINSISCSGSKFGILTSFKTTLIILIKNDNMTFTNEECILDIKYLVIDHLQPYCTLKSIIYSLLVDQFTSPLNVQHHRYEKALKFKTNFLTSPPIVEKKLQLSREYLRFKYDAKTLRENEENIEVVIDSNVTPIGTLKDYDHMVRSIYLKKSHFNPDDKSEDSVFIKIWDPVTFGMNDDPAQNQEQMEFEYLNSYHNQTNVNKSLVGSAKCWKRGFLVVKDENSKILSLGKFMAFEVSNMSSQMKYQPMEVILLKALSQLEALNAKGFGLYVNIDAEDDKFNPEKDMILQKNGELSIINVAGTGEHPRSEPGRKFDREFLIDGMKKFYEGFEG